MAFLINQSVISIKLTDTGRELLSRGELKFKKYGIGDSEIDYAFNTNSGFDGLNASILRPRDNNPEIISFIPKVQNGDNLTSLPSIVSNTSIITNTTNDRGFLGVSAGTTIIFEDPSRCKQPDCQIVISGVTGGTILTINQSAAYGSNIVEPIVGDYLLVKWANPKITEGTVTFLLNQEIPYLWYKIETIHSGTLKTDDLLISVDRNTPNFSGSGDTINAGALIYPNSNDRNINGDSIQNYYGAPFISDFVSESVLAFQNNFDVPTIDVPVWNMSIIFAEEIAGIGTNDRHFGQYFTKSYGGFVRYIEELDPNTKKIGLIHYSNNSPSNIYGEGFKEDTPILEIPTIMWHKETGATIGLVLSADTTSKATMPNLNVEYFNLVDTYGNIVGKVFNDLKIFVIEDQELLFAMSYKGNRSWTLPALQANFNVSLCPDSDLSITEVNVL